MLIKKLFVIFPPNLDMVWVVIICDNVKCDDIRDILAGGREAGTSEPVNPLLLCNNYNWYKY